jgi:DNA/RNA endonuclease YhcR with UshA esterase domain
MDHPLMRYITRLLAIICTSLLLTTSTQGETISPKDAAQYVGSTLTVEGKVSQVSFANSGTTFINFGGRFPNHVFYAVIFRSSSDLFPDIASLRGMTVAISGTVEMYKGKPQIVLSSPNQIEIRN